MQKYFQPVREDCLKYNPFLTWQPCHPHRGEAFPPSQEKEALFVLESTWTQKGFINEESENTSHLLDQSSDGELKHSNLMLFTVTRMLNPRYPVSPHHPTSCYSSLAAGKLSCQEKRTQMEKTSWNGLFEYWISSWTVATSETKRYFAFFKIRL